MSRTNRATTETRDRLLKAAIEVFSIEGYVGATTREIARVAAVNEVTLFRHFQSKEQLLSAVAQHITATRTLAAPWPSNLARTCAADDPLSTQSSTMTICWPAIGKS